MIPSFAANLSVKRIDRLYVTPIAVHVTAESYLVPTPDSLPYLQTWIKPEQHYFEFDLLSCRHAVVRLSGTLLNTGTTDDGKFAVSRKIFPKGNLNVTPV